MTDMLVLLERLDEEVTLCTNLINEEIDEDEPDKEWIHYLKGKRDGYISVAAHIQYGH